MLGRIPLSDATVDNEVLAGRWRWRVWVGEIAVRVARYHDAGRDVAFDFDLRSPHYQAPTQISLEGERKLHRDANRVRLEHVNVAVRRQIGEVAEQRSEPYRDAWRTPPCGRHQDPRAAPKCFSPARASRGSVLTR